MKIITINLPEAYLKAIQILNEKGVYPSRSEAIRVALKEFLTDELKMYQELEEENFKILVRNINNNHNNRN